jgi:hypothetical protein
LYVQYFGTYRVLKTNESFIVVRYNKLNDAWRTINRRVVAQLWYL